MPLQVICNFLRIGFMFNNDSRLLSPCTLLLPPVTILFSIHYWLGDNKTTNPTKKNFSISTILTALGTTSCAHKGSALCEAHSLFFTCWHHETLADDRFLLRATVDAVPHVECQAVFTLWQERGGLWFELRLIRDVFTPTRWLQVALRRCHSRRGSRRALYWWSHSTPSPWSRKADEPSRQSSHR